MIKTESKAKIMVWDAPVRIFHWLLVLSFAGAYVTAESDRWRLIHITLGYTMGGLVAFRVIWGLVGTRYARFSNFVRGPSAVWQYLKSLSTRKPERYLGHNPVGAVMVLLFLLSSALIVGTGWAVYHEVGSEALEDWHEGAANFMLGLVIVHVIGVMLACSKHRENLIRAMFTGKKRGEFSQAIPRVWSGLAALIVVVMLGFWYWQWQWHNAPTAVTSKETASEAKPEKAERSDRD